MNPEVHVKLEWKAAPTAPSFLAQLNPFLPLIQAALIAVIGFVLTGRLDTALKERQTSVQERQATVQALDKMSKLLTDLNTLPKQTDDERRKQNDERERIVLQVAMFGSDAIYPLFVMAVSKNAFPPETAIVGLRLLAVKDLDKVCALLLNADNVPTSINEIRKGAIKQLTEELKCATQKAKP